MNLKEAQTKLDNDTRRMDALYGHLPLCHDQYIRRTTMKKSYLTKPYNKPELAIEHEKLLGYVRKRTGIKEVPLGPISEKLVMLYGYLEDRGDEPLIELKVEWLKEMIDEIDTKVQELLKAIHDD